MGNLEILVGTKGVLLISGGRERSGWAVGGGDWHGAGIWRTDDDGNSWQVVKLTKGQLDERAANDPDFARMIGWTDDSLPFGGAFSQIWSLALSHVTLYAGTKPAGLLSSCNRGETWKQVETLTSHHCRAILRSTADLGQHFRRRRVFDRRWRRDMVATQPSDERQRLRKARSPGRAHGC